MAGNWQTVPLAELIKPDKGISYGIVQPGAHEADGIPIVRVTDVRNGRIAIHSPLRVAQAIERAHARTRLSGGELLLTIVGTVGECAVVPKSLAGWNTARAIAGECQKNGVSGTARGGWKSQFYSAGMRPWKNTANCPSTALQFQSDRSHFFSSLRRAR